jgi:hydrophobe/amphiphile efflux-1 (HAE1) family protein
MNISYPFIRRPVGTTLLAIGIFLLGAVAYSFLPVASVPTADFPTIRVSAGRPGADPVTMAATIAAPLERRLATIAGVSEITSISSLGMSNISIQFDLSRNIDGAARDVQAALNASATDLPVDMPTLPTFRKANPAAMPVLILALTSKTVPPSAIYDAADSVIVQRIAQVPGVADVTVSGADQPAIRVRVDPGVIAAAGISLEEIRTAIANANSLTPVGSFDGTHQTEMIATNEQMRSPAVYADVVVKTRNGNVVRLSDVATIEQGTRNSRSAAWFNRQPAILIMITRANNANVIETVDAIRTLIPELKRWIPAGIDISVVSDRTGTIRASVLDMQYTLVATIVLVMLVVFLFLRRGTPMIAAGITVPLSLAGTCAAMWAVGYSINNLSLMALAVSVGFVVDDAIVMIENMFRNLEKGHSPLRAAYEGARQIGFTVVTISISLIAAFIPLLFMDGVVGRVFREFSLTLAFAVVISMFVSLSVTPMICAHFVREPPSRDRTWLDRAVEAVLTRLMAGYATSLTFVLRHRILTLIFLLATIAVTVQLYRTTPRGYFPQDDTGLVMGWSNAAPDISFKAMAELQQQVAEIVISDPAVASVGSTVGGSSWSGSVNRGRMFIALKPLAERGGLSSARVIDRMRQKVSRVPGIGLWMAPAQDLRVGARQGTSDYQFTLWSHDLEELHKWVPRAAEKIKNLPGFVDVSTDRESSGLQLNVSIDRQAAARLGVRIQDIETALNNAFAQRQISTIYTRRNQYRVILEIDPEFQRDPEDLTRIYVPGNGGAQVPLSTVAKFERALAPLVVNHQGQFPSVTISYGLKPDYPLETATVAVRRAVAELHLPDVIRADFAGDAKAFAQAVGKQPLLILAALLAVYIVLGVLYESLAHPLTIVSTLPAAGLGALLALQVTGSELTVIAFIGIILLIGLVKKNGIMLVDFALDAERRRGLSPDQAIFDACLARFRPILMTTMAALLGALPFIIATGPGSELRRPLGITIVGGLMVSQILTLYTTPVIYLMLHKLHRRWGGAEQGRLWRRFREGAAGPLPAAGSS